MANVFGEQLLALLIDGIIIGRGTTPPPGGGLRVTPGRRQHC